MAQKKITDLTLRSDADATCNFPVEDGTQTWRITMAQISTYLQALTGWITGKTADATPDGTADYVQTYDASATALKKVLIDKLLTTTGITGQTEDTAPDVSADYILAYDASATALKKVLMRRVNDLVIQTKSTTYTALHTDGLIAVTTASAWTLTLPAANTSTHPIRVKKTSSDFNALTIARAGSDTIEDVTGAETSTTIDTQGEEITLAPDGSSKWYIVDRRIPSVKTGYTPAYTGFGTVSTSEVDYQRIGNSILIQGRFLAGTATSTEGRISLPSGLTSAAIASIRLAGFAIRSSAAGVSFSTLIEPSTTYITCGIQDGTRGGLTKQNGDQIASGASYSFQATVPILGWKG